MSALYAIVPAAGSGSRLGGEAPKQYQLLAGRPLLHHSLATLCRCRAIERVWVVLAPDDGCWRRHDWTSLGHKLETVFCGGTTRAESVANGLRAAATVALDDDWVLVHDAARPCLSPAMLAALCDELAEDAVGGLLAVPVADTLKRADSGQRVARSEPRDGLWQAQTPQMFRYGLLTRVLAEHPGGTDEASAVEAAGLRPRLVRGDASNLKVTFPGDLRLAEMILQAQARWGE
ncbi:2-C-methyl-D-erythritol 4-phosphate cytidylyltransferase [Accumulibacter sp.]|uniref:2-C-methyl-D-erythritol 4-phosphate cytidylyltransferase n=1 Tax=Accumulibacter sp. TaxID=2053492 RepID=UPI0025D8C344|nr:2-C-methyl-D-erythritol 4-phosphate cytidylyltransferase [Accumulibacter sp.]MCM8611372.1 2-C-methyl-D-erythritol 4-phosphate cytidylyltransferase [Accumulibacter sp.]MCM8634981.1 2-C-methyl-D-erythritol 4-phosphate cytidylyltransferase [Accumulibacter sp.]MCM8639769.1 2-C-methyl-D-erythritol 4-phosphate cytidylyltransferase [Accumulibacter sp.]